MKLFYVAPLCSDRHITRKANFSTSFAFCQDIVLSHTVMSPSSLNLLCCRNNKLGIGSGGKDVEEFTPLPRQLFAGHHVTCVAGNKGGTIVLTGEIMQSCKAHSSGLSKSYCTVQHNSRIKRMLAGAC